MDIKKLFKDVNPFDTKKFLGYMNKTTSNIIKIQDTLSPDEYSEIMEFFGPKIQKWGNYTSIHNDRDREPINVLYSKIFTICLDNIEKRIISKTITIPQLLRVMDAMYPYDISNKCMFGDDTLAVGDRIRSLMDFDDGERYLLFPLFSLQKKLKEISVYQFVFEKLLSHFPIFKVIRLFSTCPNIIYKQGNLDTKIIDVFTVSSVTYTSFILAQVANVKDQKTREDWVNKLLKDKDVNPLIKNKIIGYPKQLN